MKNQRKYLKLLSGVTIESVSEISLYQIEPLAREVCCGQNCSQDLLLRHAGEVPLDETRCGVLRVQIIGLKCGDSRECVKACDRSKPAPQLANSINDTFAVQNSKLKIIKFSNLMGSGPFSNPPQQVCSTKEVTVYGWKPTGSYGIPNRT